MLAEIEMESLMEELEQSSCICSYYIYGIVWDAVIGEQAMCVQTPLNESDRYTVA